MTRPCIFPGFWRVNSCRGKSREGAAHREEQTLTPLWATLLQREVIKEELIVICSYRFSFATWSPLIRPGLTFLDVLPLASIILKMHLQALLTWVKNITSFMMALRCPLADVFTVGMGKREQNNTVQNWNKPQENTWPTNSEHPWSFPDDKVR